MALLTPRLVGWLIYGALLASSVLTWALLPQQAGGFMPYLTRQDFMGLYVGPHLVVNGDIADLYNLDAQLVLQRSLTEPHGDIIHILHFVYPGWVATLLLPLGTLSFAAAFLALTAVTMPAGFAATWALARSNSSTRNEMALMLLAMIGFVPLWYTLWQGQLGIFPLVALVGAVLALRRKAPISAGLWLAIGLIKPQLVAVPALGLLASGRWRSLAVMSGVGAALLALSFAVLGNWIPSYLSMLAEYTRPDAEIGDDPNIMHNWRGFFFRLAGGDVPLVPTLFSGLSILLALALMWPRSPLARPNLEARLAVIIILGLLAVPHLYLHDTVIALVSGALLWRAAGDALYRGGNKGKLLALRGLLAAGPVVARVALSWAPPGVAVGAWYFVALLIAVFLAWPSLSLAESQKMEKVRAEPEE
jgi:hypothetical protein